MTKNVKFNSQECLIADSKIKFHESLLNFLKIDNEKSQTASIKIRLATKIDFPSISNIQMKFAENLSSFNLITREVLKAHEHLTTELIKLFSVTRQLSLCAVLSTFFYILSIKLKQVLQIASSQPCTCIILQVNAKNT